MTLRLIEQFERHCADAPDRIAVRQVECAGTPARSVSRGELSAWVNGFATRLAGVAPPGAVVLMCSPNQPEFAAAFLATLRAGLRAFPVSPEMAAPELVSAAERSGAVALIGDETSRNVLRGRVSDSIATEDVPSFANSSKRLGRAGDAGLLLLSSGTTGTPKIVFRDARSLDAVSEAMAHAIGFTESDDVLACVPLAHSYGLEHGLLAPAWAGSCVHLSRGFDLRAALREVTDTGVSIFPGVPFMFEMLAQHAREGSTFPRLRRAYSAGGPLPRGVADAFAERLRVPVTQLYGATEIGSVTYSNPDAHGFDAGSVGRPMRGVDVKILAPDTLDVNAPLPAGEEGHVAVAAASMLREYLGEPTLPTVDGYFLTGDLGRVDSSGNLTITGRIKLLIDVGGLKVNPLEVEAVLAQHPGVESCVVLPVPVSETVSRLRALVTPREGATEPPAPASLRAFARERLAGYKVPRVFEIRDSLPKSPTGKILRHLVKA